MTPQDDPTDVEEHDRMLRIGAAFEAAGLMPQGDYVRLARLSKNVERGEGSISDADLDWVLMLLANAAEAVVRSKVMVLLSACCRHGAFSQAQRERIAAAVAPFEDSEHQLDRLSAAEARRAVFPRVSGRLQPPSDN